MAVTLPIGIRIAAGLLGSVIDRLSTLPSELPGMGVSLVGQAVKTSFLVRQEIAGLASRGDELLAGIFDRPQENPAWATFDEDEDDDTEAQGGKDHTSVGATDTAQPDAAGQHTAATDGDASTAAAVAAPMTLTMSQLKTHLQDLDAAQVSQLLLQEEAGANRAPYLTLLTNRLTTLGHQNGLPGTR